MLYIIIIYTIDKKKKKSFVAFGMHGLLDYLHAKGEPSQPYTDLDGVCWSTYIAFLTACIDKQFHGCSKYICPSLEKKGMTVGCTICG
jgi:hypothetical protein